MPASLTVFNIARFGIAAAAITLLVACTSTESTLDPNALRTQQNTEPASPADVTPPATPAAPAEMATAQTPAQPAIPSAQSASLQLASVLGAPAQAVSILTARMIEEGPARNLTVSSTSGSSSYALKGFLSTSPENGKTFIYYAWDISDQSGAALHRLTGKQAATGAGAGWTSVVQADLEAVADQTLNGFAAWLATR